MIPQNGENLECKLLYGDNQIADIKAFTLAGMGNIENFLLIEKWTGNLHFKLNPGEKTWILLLFDIPIDVTKAKLKLKTAPPIDITIPEAK